MDWSVDRTIIDLVVLGVFWFETFCFLIFSIILVSRLWYKDRVFPWIGCFIGGQCIEDDDLSSEHLYINKERETIHSSETETFYSFIYLSHGCTNWYLTII